MKNVDNILVLADSFYEKCQQGIVKIAKIRKLPNGKYRVLSEKGKNLGTYKSRDGAKKRLVQVEYFKHFDHSNADDSKLIDLSKLKDFSFSAFMRELRQKASKEQVVEFLKIHKSYFDKAVRDKLQKPDKVSLQNSVVKFNKFHKIKIDTKIIKNAAISELGDAASVGKYLSDIVKFILNRLSDDGKTKAISNLKDKFFNLNENEISSKEMPPSSALGQSITFVKTVLFSHDAKYVRDVLNSLINNL